MVGNTGSFTPEGNHIRCEIGNPNYHKTSLALSRTPTRNAVRDILRQKKMMDTSKDDNSGTRGFSRLRDIVMFDCF